MSRQPDSDRTQESSASGSSPQRQRQRLQTPATGTAVSPWALPTHNIQSVHPDLTNDMSVLSACSEYATDLSITHAASSAHLDQSRPLGLRDDLNENFNFTIEDVDIASGHYTASPFDAVSFSARPSPTTTAGHQFSFGQQDHNSEFDQWSGPTDASLAFSSGHFQMSPVDAFPPLQDASAFSVRTDTTEGSGGFGISPDYQLQDSSIFGPGHLPHNSVQVPRRRSASRNQQQSGDEHATQEEVELESFSPRALSRGSTWNHPISPSQDPPIRSLQRHSTLGPYGPVDITQVARQSISGSDSSRSPGFSSYEASAPRSIDNAMSLEYLSSPDTPSVSASAYEDDGSQLNDPGSPSTLQAPSSGHPQDLKNHVLLVTPSTQPYLLDRICKEQLKRYQRLSDWKMKHEEAVSAGSCASDAQCHLLGHPIILKPISKASGPQVTFVIDAADIPESRPVASREHRYEKATFPEGIPHPPVKSLPAKFECTLCFQVKQFDKPSDWTKHVHEDVQPFTCTFPCPDAKSFKRKADWLRHENERHRQLEKWVCSIKDCAHICHRKDNFIQHLVREHRLPEPRNRAVTGRNEITDPHISRLVRDCRIDTTDQAPNEPCRFCNETFPDWKKLTAHVSKHMEQISLPLIELINQLGPASAPMPSLPRARTSNATSSRQSSFDQEIQPVSRTHSVGDDRSSTHSRRVSRDSSGAPRRTSSNVYQPSLLAPPDPAVALSQPDSPMSDSTNIFSPIVQSPDVMSAQGTHFAWPSSTGYAASPIDAASMTWDTASTNPQRNVDNDITMAGTQFAYDPTYDQVNASGSTYTVPTNTAGHTQREQLRPSSGSRSPSDNTRASSRATGKARQSTSEGNRSSIGQKKRLGKG